VEVVVNNRDNLDRSYLEEDWDYRLQDKGEDRRQEEREVGKEVKEKRDKEGGEVLENR